MKRLAIATLVVVLGFGVALAQDKPATDKPAAPQTSDKAKDAGCGESSGCCGEMKASKAKKSSKQTKSAKAQKPAPKPAGDAPGPEKAN